MEKANPVLVGTRRGDAVECRHRGAAAVVDFAGSVRETWGEAARPIFPRSAAKPLLALAIVESGAARRFAVGDEEIALACSSHNGEPVHVQAVAAWLGRMGLSAQDLECGDLPPWDARAAVDLIRAGTEPAPLHHNCSGKHAGMLATALHMGEPTAGYVRPGHPVQVRVERILAEMGSVDLGDAPRGIDGCSIPVIAMPLTALARAMAALAKPGDLPPGRAEAARRIAGAMTAQPYMVAGRGRFDTEILQAGGGALLVKTGAGGVHAAALLDAGLGVALKIDDGSREAAETAMAALLVHLGALGGEGSAALAPYLERPVLNAAGVLAGVMRPAKGWPG